MRAALLVLVLGGCSKVDADGFTWRPRRWEVLEVIRGSAEAGFGTAVAWGPDGEPRIGAPFQGPGRLHRTDRVVLEGIDGDFLGAALLGGERVRVGVPGRGLVVDEAGEVILDEGPESRVGGAIVGHGDGIAAIGQGRVVGQGGFVVEQRVWSLVSATLDGRTPVLIAGLASGGVVSGGQTFAGPGALGRGLAACDLDEDGDDDLVIADPTTGRVQLHLVDDLGALDLDAPDSRHELGPGAGMSVACVAGGLLVGAPDLAGGGGVAWLRDPRAEREARWLPGESGGRLGQALAVGHGAVLVGDPGRGEVWRLGPRRR